MVNHGNERETMTTTDTMTARERVLAEYENDGKGRITQPGKFEGEPVFAPHYWDMGLSGFADGDDGQVYSFKFTHSVNSGREQCAEFAEWPELKEWLGRKRTLRMREDSQGFVHCF